MLKQIINRYNYVGLILVNGSVLNALDQIGLYFMSNSVSFTSYKEEIFFNYLKILKSPINSRDFEISYEFSYIENKKKLTFLTNKVKKSNKIYKPILCKKKQLAKNEWFILKKNILTNTIIVCTEDEMWNNKYVSSKMLNISKHSITSIFFNI